MLMKDMQKYAPFITGGWVTLFLRKPPTLRLRNAYVHISQWLILVQLPCCDYGWYSKRIITSSVIYTSSHIHLRYYFTICYYWYYSCNNEILCGGSFTSAESTIYIYLACLVLPPDLNLNASPRLSRVNLAIIILNGAITYSL